MPAELARISDFSMISLPPEFDPEYPSALFSIVA
jgi:hypothetical protein